MEDKTRDNWLALCVCILTNKSCERALASMGIKAPRDEVCKWDKETVKEGIRFKKSGLSWNDICTKLDVRKASAFMYAVRKEMGPQPKKRRVWSDEDVAKLSELRAEGKLWKEIGESFGVTGSNAARVWRERTNPPPVNLKWNRKFYNEISRQLEQGYTLDELAEKYNKQADGFKSKYRELRRIYK